MGLGVVTFLSEVELAAAAAMAHRLETADLQARIERMTALLREHGIAEPAEDPRLTASDHDHLILCRNVVVAAYELLERLEELRLAIGSGIELVGGEPWRA